MIILPKTIKCDLRRDFCYNEGELMIRQVSYMLNNGQDLAPLVEAICHRINANYLPFHMPGHKGGAGVTDRWRKITGGSLALDLTEVEGLDDLHNPHGVIKSAQELAASLMGSEAAFFLVNGATGGILASILALCRKGEKIIIPRHAHRSVYSGIVLSGAKPVYIGSKISPEWGIPLGVEHDHVTAVLQANKDAQCLVMVHPTYHGLTSDLSRIVDTACCNNVPVVVDEAHGAHFKFSPGLSETAMSCGAALAVQGWHKTMGALTQSGMLLLKDKRINIEDYLMALQSTSPSYLLMASLDEARRNWAVNGTEIMDRVLELTRYFRKEVKNIKGITCLNRELLLDYSVVRNLDPTKLVVSAREMGLNGFQLASELRERYKIEPEMAEFTAVTLMVTIGDTRETVGCLLSALKDLSGRYWGQKDKIRENFPYPPIPQMMVLPGEAVKLPKRNVAFNDAVGEISAEYVCPYPPGIPLVVPGEVITEEIVEITKLTLALGGWIQGLRDSANEMWQVIDA
ncbi:MAG: aminotransferase class I/II-fold pyridoxal phosphate-dependent enzyme [Clostridia bacterium]|jgi:arginine decarboxylase|nr:aminotransferase class I/II-fold pyridoxal phosphate-dependent enzyme [Clostridia bacterium]